MQILFADPISARFKSLSTLLTHRPRASFLRRFEVFAAGEKGVVEVGRVRFQFARQLCLKTVQLLSRRRKGGKMRKMEGGGGSLVVP